MKIAVILSGSGVFDGSEIHESVLTFLAISENNATYECFAPDKPMAHVINHITGQVMEEERNVLIESARISRGIIQSILECNANEYDGLVIPGGFGAAKNLNRWAFEGEKGNLDEDVKNVILQFLRSKKPICGLCMGPTVIAKALEGSGISSLLTVGTTHEPSPFEIENISKGMENIGAKTEMKNINEISVDIENLIITAPCYMMEANILQVRNNIKQAIDKLFSFIKR